MNKQNNANGKNLGNIGAVGAVGAVGAMGNIGANSQPSQNIPVSSVSPSNSKIADSQQAPNVPPVPQKIQMKP